MLEEVLAPLVSLKIHITNLEENEYMVLEQGQTFSLAFFAFVDFVGSIVVVVVGEHIIVDMWLVVD